MRYRPLWPLLAGVLLLGAWSGCGPGNPLGRKAISGKVTLDDKPLEQGTISFEPLAKKGVSAGAVISAGSYSIAAEKGLPPGKYRVRINASQGGEKAAGTAPPGPTTAAAPKSLIPPKYNTQSDLSAEVTEAGPNQFDFPLQSK
jgi:hypothetical protein